MSAQTQVAPLPLVTDDDGVIRIAGTRIALEILWEAFQEGLTAEAITEQYPALTLAQVYLVIGWMLANPAEVERYLRGRSARAADVRAANERLFPPDGIRDRLLARRVASVTAEKV